MTPARAVPIESGSGTILRQTVYKAVYLATVIANRRALAAVVALLFPLAATAADGTWVEPHSGCKVWLSADKIDNYTFQWVGPCRDGYANGAGTLNIFYKGEPAGWYAGPMNAGKFEGRGIRSYPDLGRYEGDWRDGRRNGQGTVKWPDGTTYVGGFRDDKASGTGTLTDKNGTNFTGTWLSGCLRRSPGQLRPPIGVGANSCPGY